MANGDAVGVYGAFKVDLLEADVDLANGGDSFKIFLLTGHTPDLTNHTGWASVSADEVTNVSGYTAGGTAISGQAVSAVGANAKWDATDFTWSSLEVSETPSHVGLYDDTHASDRLVGLWVCTTVTNGGDYTIEWNASGILTLS